MICRLMTRGVSLKMDATSCGSVMIGRDSTRIRKGWFGTNVSSFKGLRRTLCRPMCSNAGDNRALYDAGV